MCLDILDDERYLVGNGVLGFSYLLCYKVWLRQRSWDKNNDEKWGYDPITETKRIQFTSYFAWTKHRTICRGKHVSWTA